MNILVNAIQAIKDMGTIKIKTVLDNNKIKISISDDGKGIKAEDLAKIFDSGFTTKGVGEGTGLGLSISYKIAQTHKGDIKVTSSVGKGTEFVIILPAV